MRPIKELWTPTTRLYDRADEGRPDRFVLDCGFTPLNFRDGQGIWQEIDLTPTVSDQAGFNLMVPNAPYKAYFSQAGDRRIYPDRNDLSRYINIPATRFLSGKSLTRVGNTLVWSSAGYDIILAWKNTKVKMSVVLNRALPPQWGNQVQFDIDKVGIDDATFLSYLAGLVAVDSSPDPIVRPLNVSLQGGVLTLGFDLSGMTLPITIDPTIDVYVTAGADDYQVYGYSTEGSGGTFSSTTPGSEFGNNTDTNKRSSGARWASGITIPAGATITVAYIQFVGETAQSGTVCNVAIWGNDVAAPTSPTTVAGYWGLAKTTAQVNWDALSAWVVGTTYQTPSLVSLIQELVDSYAPYSNGAIQLIFWNNASSTGARRAWSTYESTRTEPLLHIEYTSVTQKTVTDSLALADAAPGIAARLAVAESLGLADTLPGGTPKALLSLAEALTLADVLTVKAFLTLADSLALTDALGVAVQKLVTDALALAETVSLKGFVSLTQGLNISDALGTTARLTVADALALVETVSPKQFKSIADSLALADQVAAAVLVVRLLVLASLLKEGLEMSGTAGPAMTLSAISGRGLKLESTMKGG